MSTKLEMDTAYEKGLPPTMVTWYNGCATSKKKLYLCFHMDHDCQTSQNGG